VSIARPELLAPAGDWESLRAAVANGADAVYFGLSRFNARQRAANFTPAELHEVIAYLHDRNTKGYVTFNTLIFPDELRQAAEYGRAIAEAGADAAIVQDLGLIELLRRMVPTLPIHASTQMTQSEPAGIEFLRALGVSRVILARELSLAELARLVRETTMPVEVFVHGALCVSFSGQCLASESLWGRSANRGVCGQACRLPYQLVVDGQPHPLGDREYLLSPHDLAAYDRLPQLVELGVAAFKIEGRLKSAVYVAATTRIYRAALDAAIRREPLALSPEHADELAQSFSRGFGHGFLDGVDHQKLVPGRFPKSRGVCVGQVVVKSRGAVVVELAGAPSECPLKPGDGVVFDEGHPEQDEQGGRIFAVRPVVARTFRVALSFGRDDVDLAAVPIGCAVWKTDDPAVRRRLEGTYGRDVRVRRRPLHVRVEAQCGELLRISVSDDSGHDAAVTWDQPLRTAEKHPLTVELLRRQFGRLGDTRFELARVELLGSEGATESCAVMVPRSVLNDLRRRAVQALLERCVAAERHDVVNSAALELIRSELPSNLAGRTDSQPLLHVLARSPEQFEAVAGWHTSATAVAQGVLYADFRHSGDHDRAAAVARDSAWTFGVATPRILLPGEESDLAQLVACAPRAVLVRNLGSLCHLRRHFQQLTLIADHSLNLVNELSALVLTRGGVARMTPGYDLSWKRVGLLLAQVCAAQCEIILHQHVPLFHTRHCLFAANLSDGSRCGDCGRRCTSHECAVRDRNGAAHPVLPDSMGRSTVFHAAAQTAADHLPYMQRVGLRHFRVELLRESPEQACALLDVYAGLLSGDGDGRDLLHRLRALCPKAGTRGANTGRSEH
jgi:U32 family peptidase